MKPTDSSIDEYLASRASGDQLADCKALMALFRRVTKCAPRMWGPNIVGCGAYTYEYESGRTGEAPLAAFAVRGKELVAYLDVDSPEQQQRLSRLGRYRMGKSCLYFKRLAELDTSMLEALVAESVAMRKRRYPGAGGA
ncbi:DUF1801 domain-containing protein [Piscinibacter sp.]|uniref:DUF1801 domain-containing protein n=1 Tax=Piscinibacter sp. TaxID=1903157 RepID=UPI0039E3E89D